MSLYYSVFGGRVCSDVLLPELLPADLGAADWRLERVEDRLPTPEGPVLGTAVKGNCHVTLWRSGDGYRLRHSCVGEYEIECGGSRIRWWRETAAPNAAIQNDLVGRILPLVFHARGALCLHASAVALDRTAIAFVADPRGGKSTLAYALVRAGAQLVSDDVAVLETQARVVMRRGVEHVRLRRDASERLVDGGASQSIPLDGKDVVQVNAGSRVGDQTLPLGCIYVLAPARRKDPAARRDIVPPRAATLLLMRHARMGRVLCGASGGEMLERAAAVARQVPVYALHIAQNLARISAVAEQVQEWHCDSVVLATGTNG